MAKNEIFRKSSLDRVSSPEKLNDYIKVSNPNVWIIILALLIMLGAAFVWATVGKLPTTIQKTGMFSGQDLQEKSIDYITCFLSESDVTGERSNSSDKESGVQEDVAAIKVGQKVEISPAGSNSKKDGTIEGIITEVTAQSVNAEEIPKQLGTSNLETTSSDYLYKALIKIEKTGNDFKWSKGSNPTGVIIEPGTTCKISIFTEEIKPIDFLVQ